MTATLPYETALARPGARAKELVKAAIAATAAPFGSILRVATREPAIALTFDDGPDPTTTPSVLEILERHGARGTFFAVGERVRRHPALVDRIARGGHALANHSRDHASFLRIDGAARRAEIRDCDAALGSHASGLFRPPFAEQSVASLGDARRCGQRVVIGDVVAEDWRDDPAERLVARMLRRMRRGSIVLCHDSLYVTDDERFRDRAPLVAALDEILGRFAASYRFVTVPELLRLGRAVHGHWYHRLPPSFHAALRKAADAAAAR